MLDFTPVPTTTTTCGHTVARMGQARWNVDASDNGYAEGLADLAALLTGCPIPDDCALDAAWRLDEKVGVR